ncbi:MAG: sensor histidine kinase [Thermodesulfobacteriota bacterium]
MGKNGFSDSSDFFEITAKLEDEKINSNLLKKLVKDYAYLERRLTETVDQKNYVLGVAAHDIRNPLVSIRGFADLLKDGGTGELSEIQQEFISLISSTSDELLVLLNDLLDFSSVSGGKVGLNKEKTDFVSLVEKKVELMNYTAAKKDMVIKIENKPEKIPHFFDKGKIAQVIDNLLSNAVKYSFIGSEIKVLIFLKNSSIRLEVEDNGPGIPKGEEKDLFGEFKKLNVASTGGEKSTGLGLAISKRIVEAHEGKIFGRNNNEHKGAVFGFEIPLEVR